MYTEFIMSVHVCVCVGVLASVFVWVAGRPFIMSLYLVYNEFIRNVCVCVCLCVSVCVCVCLCVWPADRLKLVYNEFVVCVCL